MGDALSSVTDIYIEFVQQVQIKLVNSLNFKEDLCKLVSNLRGNMSVAELSPLAGLYSTENADLLGTSLEEVCRDTAITATAVQEGRLVLCNQKYFDDNL